MLKDLRQQLRQNRQASLSQPAVEHRPHPDADPNERLFRASGDPDESQVPSLGSRGNDERIALPARLQASLATLNPEQLTAVLDTSPAVLVRAQVGSGKTAVLVHKILYLHQVLGVPLRRMAILTFTHRAAEEIRTRIETLAGESAPLTAADFWLTGTFHGVARALLLQALDLTEIGYRPGFSVLDARAQEALWQRLIAEHDLTIKYPSRLAQRVEAVAHGRTRFGQMRADDDIVKLAALAREERVATNAMDFNDLIVHSCSLLAHQPLAQPLEWVIVDEFQDCEPRELELLHRLRGPDTKLFAVGDPHQVIYAWRGSTPALFEKVEKAFGCTTLSLPVNYRSTQTILGAARAVLGLQVGTGGTLRGARGAGEPVVIRRHHNPAIEGLYLAQRIARLNDAGVPYSEVAILYRTRRQGTPLREALEHAQVPCQESLRAEPKDEPAVAWLLDLLAAALHADDAGPLRAALTHPHFGAVPARLWNQRSFRAFCESGATAGLHAGRAFLQHVRERSKAARANRDLEDALSACDLLTGLGTWLGNQAGDARLDEALAVHLHLVDHLRPTSASHAADLAAARRLLKALIGFARHAQTDIVSGLRAALAQAALGGLQGLAETLDPQANAVRLMTLHAAKGLEFSHVFISGANHGLLPLARAWGDADAEAEERRLLFVGMTRARDGLEISVHTQPAHATALPTACGYLYAIAAGHVRWVEKETDAEAQAPRVPAEANDASGAAPAGIAAGARGVTFADGQPVKHPRYGNGQVQRTEGGLVYVQFEKFGDRLFPERLCPLTPA